MGGPDFSKGRMEKCVVFGRTHHGGYFCRETGVRVVEPTLKAKDLERVHKALMLHSQRLVGACRWAGYERVVTTGECGETAEDLASETLLKFLDPSDRSVKWKAAYGDITVPALVAFLKRVLRNDFLDLKKREKFRKQVEAQLSDIDDEGDESSGMEGFPSSAEPADLVAIQQQQRSIVLKYFEAWPELLEIVKLQIQPEGYSGFTNIELAQLLDTTVSDIEDRKKRILNRFARLARERR